jgi:hypothetical protein
LYGGINICGSSVWKSLQVSFPAPRILKRFVDFFGKVVQIWLCSKELYDVFKRCCTISHRSRLEIRAEATSTFERQHLKYTSHFSQYWNIFKAILNTQLTPLKWIMKKW